MCIGKVIFVLQIFIIIYINYFSYDHALQLNPNLDAA